MKINSSVINSKNMTNDKSTKFGSLSQVTNKTLKAFEFSGFNYSLLGLAGICYGAVGLTRYIKARDKYEKREVVFRDLISVTTIIFARRSLQNIFSKICSKASGLALATKPKNHSGFFQKAYNYIRPIKGINIISSKNLQAKYSNIQEYKNGIVSFAEFLNNNGGNIKKAFKNDNVLHKNLKQLYNSWKPEENKHLKVAFEKAENNNFIKMFKSITANGNKPQELKNIENVLKNPNNKLVQKSKFLNSSFDFLTMFMLVPTLLGFVIPYTNNKITQNNKLKDANLKK